MKKILVTLLISMFLTLSIEAQHYLVEDINGRWTSTDPNSGISGVGTNQIEWGTPVTGNRQSRFTFNSTTDPSDRRIGNSFNVGRLIYRNRDTTETTLSNATLTTSMDIIIGNQLFNNISFDNLFSLSGNNVTIKPSTFIFGTNNEYTLDVLGFRINGQFVTSFDSVEGQNNRQNLFAVVQDRNVEVPEPGTYLILTSVSMMTVIAAKRRKIA